VTETGSEMVRWCQRILIEFREAERALKSITTNNLLRISAPAVLAKHPIENTVSSIASKWPRSTIEIYDQKSANEVWDSVMTNQVDIGFTNDYQKSELDTLLVGRHRLICAFPPNAEASPSKTISLDEVSTYRWIVGPPPSYYRRRLLEEHLQAQGLKYELHIITAHRHIMQNLVLSGVGPAIIIQEEAEEYESLGASIRIIEPAIYRRYYMLYKRQYLSDIGRDFVNEVAKTWGETPDK
jgi:DNA-binding transcriptional LysR family regulator